MLVDLLPSQVRMVGRDITLQDGSLVFVRNVSEGESGSLEAIASQTLKIGPSSRPEPLISALISQKLRGWTRPWMFSVNSPQIMIQNGGGDIVKSGV